MEKMKDLKDLLTHEVQDLYSAEEQIIEAMPAMIEKSQDAELKKALKEHLRITEGQKNRLDQVKKLLGEIGDNQQPGEQGTGEGGGEGKGEGEQKKGFFS